MAFPLGFRRNDLRESIWYMDPAVNVDRVPEPTIKAYFADLEAKHLTPFLRPGQSATRVTFRALTADERARIESACTRYELDPKAKPGDANGVKVHDLPDLRALLAFAVGCDLPDLPDPVPFKDGPAPKYIREDGLTRLSPDVVNWLVDLFGPTIYRLYGGHVLRSSQAARDDFLASSRTSTGRNSAASTATPAPTDSSANGIAQTSGKPTQRRKGVG